jgi:hypothetical protein
MSPTRKTQATPRKKSAPTDAVYIYGLQDPESGEVRYVGQCRHLWRRMAGHLFNSGGETPRSKWLASLCARDLFPVFLILEKTTAQHAHAREAAWIAYYTAHNGDLLNRGIPRPQTFSEDSRVWISQGMHIAADMVEFIDQYAKAHGMQKREVVDLALRTFFADVA